MAINRKAARTALYADGSHTFIQILHE